MVTGVAVVNGSAAELPVVPSRLVMPKQEGKHALLKAFVLVLRMVAADADKVHAPEKRTADASAPANKLRRVMVRPQKPYSFFTLSPRHDVNTQGLPVSNCRQPRPHTGGALG